MRFKQVSRSNSESFEAKTQEQQQCWNVSCRQRHNADSFLVAVCLCVLYFEAVTSVWKSLLFSHKFLRCSMWRYTSSSPSSPSPRSQLTHLGPVRARVCCFKWITGTFSVKRTAAGKGRMYIIIIDMTTWSGVCINMPCFQKNFWFLQTNMGVYLKEIQARRERKSSCCWCLWCPPVLLSEAQKQLKVAKGDEL